MVLPENTRKPLLWQLGFVDGKWGGRCITPASARTIWRGSKLKRAASVNTKGNGGLTPSIYCAVVGSSRIGDDLRVVAKWRVIRSRLLYRSPSSSYSPLWRTWGRCRGRGGITECWECLRSFSNLPPAPYAAGRGW